MQRSWTLARLGTVAMLGLTAALSFGTVQAKPQEPPREKPKEKDPPEWSDPMVQGTIDKVWWAESKVKGQWTPSMSLFSNDSNVEVTVYVDNPDAQTVAKAQACIGRFIVATGDRIDAENLSALGLQVPNPGDCPDGQGLGNPPS